MQIDQQYTIVLEPNDITEADLFNWSWMKVIVEVQIETSADPITWAERKIIIFRPSIIADFDEAVPLIYTENKYYFTEALYFSVQTDPYDQEELVNIAPILSYNFVRRPLEMEFNGSSGYEPCCSDQMSWFASSCTVIIDTFDNDSIGEYTIDIVFDLNVYVATPDATSTWDNPLFDLEV